MCPSPDIANINAAPQQRVNVTFLQPSAVKNGGLLLFGRVLDYGALSMPYSAKIAMATALSVTLREGARG
jgi:hypothetical protein